MSERSERWQTLRHLDDWLRTPMLVLSLAWLVLVVIDLVSGDSELLATLGTAIWLVFIAEFALRFASLPLPFRRVTGPARHEDAVADHDRARVSGPWQRDRPLHILLGVPFRRSGAGRLTGSVRSAKAEPVFGLGGRHEACRESEESEKRAGAART